LKIPVLGTIIHAKFSLLGYKTWAPLDPTQYTSLFGQEIGTALCKP
jgi:hypothetical protein